MAGEVPHGPRLTVHQPQHTLCGQMAWGWAWAGEVRARHTCVCGAPGPRVPQPVLVSGPLEECVLKALCPPHPRARYSWDQGQQS